jgi:hypothetical protein
LLSDTDLLSDKKRKPQDVEAYVEFSEREREDGAKWKSGEHVPDSLSKEAGTRRRNPS